MTKIQPPGKKPRSVYYDAGPVQLLLTKEQKELLTRAAEAAGISVASLLRMAGLEKSREILAKLSDG